MSAHGFSVRVLTGLTVAALLAGCASGATATPGSTPSATASPTTAPSGTASASATPFASPSAPTATRTSGFVTLDGASLAVATDRHAVTGGGTPHARNAVVSIRVTTDDLRLSGTQTLSWNQDTWGDLAGGSVATVQWGTSRIENTGGTWEGKGSGVYSSDRGDMIVFWYKGSGGYAGLGCFELLSGQSPWSLRGQVFPGDPPSLTGIPAVSGAFPSPNVDVVPTPGPTPANRPEAYGTVTVFQGSSEYTYVGIGDTVWAGLNTTNDPRVTGYWLATSWTMNAWGATADTMGAGTQTGANRLTNAGGAWDGIASGIFDDYGDVIAIWNRGSGAYAGLSDFELFTRNDLFGPVGTLGPAVFGQIFPGDPPTP